MSERPPQAPNNPESALLAKHKVSIGQRAVFEKIAIHGQSSVPVGSVAEGVVQNEVRVGQSIKFDTGAVISEVRAVEEKDGALLIRTATSTYRLRSESVSQAEKFEVDDVATVETAMGSTYRYLPDGRTQRFKKVEGKEYEPQSVMVYVPDFAWAKQNFPKEMLQKIGDNETAYTQALLGYVQNPTGERKVYIVDQNGTQLESNDDLKNVTGPVYLALLSNGNSDYWIPVSVKPRVGSMTYDTRLYKDAKTGENMRERHLGNAVVKVVLKNGKEIR